jgi:hypothetical protein
LNGAVAPFKKNECVSLKGEGVMTRKEFLSASAALAAGAALGQSGKTKTASSSGSISRGLPPPRNRHT